ncbi:MAG: FHA domain-containing protein, partial [Planktothrix sp.]
MSENQGFPTIEIQARLTLVIPVNSSNPTKQSVYDLSVSQATIIGRSPDCQIPVDSNQYNTVSRRHAQINLRVGEPEPIWELCDLNSANGTFINGEKLQGCRDLRSGDRIVLSYDGPEFIFGCQSKKTTASPSKPETIEPPEIGSPPVPQSTPVTPKQEVIAKPEPKSVGVEEPPKKVGIEEVAKQVAAKQV